MSKVAYQLLLLLALTSCVYHRPECPPFVQRLDEHSGAMLTRLDEGPEIQLATEEEIASLHRVWDAAIEVWPEKAANQYVEDWRLWVVRSPGQRVVLVTDPHRWGWLDDEINYGAHNDTDHEGYGGLAFWRLDGKGTPAIFIAVYHEGRSFGRLLLHELTHLLWRLGVHNTSFSELEAELASAVRRVE